MNDHDVLAQQFENNRGHLRGVAYRMLGSLSEAEDAVQECWLRLSRSESDKVENLRAWLTTVVARVCLDMLRSRKSRGEEPLETPETSASEASAIPHHAPDPETEAMMADSVGLATLVVLDRLNPAERLAFVLHDLFDIPFDEIARIAGRTSESVRQLASRARRRVRGATKVSPEIAQQRTLVHEFLSALRAGDAAKIVALLTPEFTVEADRFAAPGVPAQIRGAEAWAKEAIRTARGARFASPALIDGVVGLVIAPRGRLFRVMRFTFTGGRIGQIDVIGDPATLEKLDLAAVSD
ncbi:MAG TPA: sigma-70 family RNA polymerase sigma factor [Acidobacteriaceae bacterium]|nr:sigma-70 family RNA polymerase sigma factor [Acidobacteriaceae bacterium]